MRSDRSTGRNVFSVIGVVWAILALPHPARPYGLAVVGVVFVYAVWKVHREDREMNRDDRDDHD